MAIEGALGPAALILKDNREGETFLFRTSARGASGAFSFEWRLAAGKHGPGEHMHPHETEHFRIIQGTVVIVLNDVPHRLKVGDTLLVPMGARHRFEHAGDTDLVAEVTLSSTYLEDQFVPLAAHFNHPEGLPLRALPQMIVHFHHWMAQGSVVLTSGALRGTFAFLAWSFRLFGVRPLTRVEGWELKGVRTAA